MFNRIKALNSRGILGMNRRNLDCVLSCNPPSKLQTVNDKIITKALAKSVSLPVPELYCTIDSISQLNTMDSKLTPYNDFVIKPANGSGGKGILIIKDRIKQKFQKQNNQLFSIDQLKGHVIKCLSGVFSLGGYPDRVMIEYRVKNTPVFNPICYQGVPDIRIVVYYGYPIMAMLRLPTIASDGKANLHQGAIGAGVVLAKGITNYGVQGNDFITEHPDTLNNITQVSIPEWSILLDMAAKSYELTGLGFLGIDIVLDETLGPLMLEINARPGLNIQIANNDGLMRRIDIVNEHRRLFAKNESIQERVKFSQENF